jgi:integrase
MRSKAVKPDTMDCVLMALQPVNRLICEISLKTGLRLSDVLNIKTEQMQKGRFTLRERKTGKNRRITIPNTLRDSALSIAGRIFVFENRLDPTKPRVRQTVWKDVKRAAKAFGFKQGLSPHSCRKSFSVRKYNACGDMRKVQALLNHDSLLTTSLYVLAEELEQRTLNAPKIAPNLNDS